MTLFWDTNVWIDFLGERHPYYEAAATILTYAEKGTCKIIISSLTMVNANFICCEKGKMPLSIWKQKVNMISDIIEVCSIDPTDITASCRSDWTDFEDAVQYFAAKRNECEIIVTRNPKDFILSEMSVQTPNEVISLLKSSL